MPYSVTDNDGKNPWREMQQDSHVQCEIPSYNKHSFIHHFIKGATGGGIKHCRTHGFDSSAGYIVHTYMSQQSLKTCLCSTRHGDASYVMKSGFSTPFHVTQLK